MTFNVRQMDGEDGAQSWDYRKQALAETIRLYTPTLLGTQETFREQADFITHTLPQYSSFGCGRFGDDRDKHNKVFYDRSHLSLLDSGECWFSLTPDVPGSAAWDIPQPRMITWGLLQIAAGPQVFVMNTHFPYGRTAGRARYEAARLANEKLNTLPPQLPVILMGDFNSPADGEVYHLLTQRLSDVWPAALHTIGPTSTVHGFGKFVGPRIDWILQRGFNPILSAETVTLRSDGLFPSDHYPVHAILTFT